jgi:uncharacterized protein (DUF1330 family)
MPQTYVAIARVPADGVEAFGAYEEAVLALLPQHGGRLARRLRDGGGRVEVHVLEFDDEDGLRRYRDDPRRAAHAEVLARSGARVELLGPLADAGTAPVTRPA